MSAQMLHSNCFVCSIFSITTNRPTHTFGQQQWAVKQMNKSAQILQLSVARAWTRGTTGGTKKNFYLLKKGLKKNELQNCGLK